MPESSHFHCQDNSEIGVQSHSELWSFKSSFANKVQFNAPKLVFAETVAWIQVALRLLRSQETNVLADKDQGIAGAGAKKKNSATENRSSRISELTFKEKGKERKRGAASRSR